MPIGWLSHDPSLPDYIEGVYVDRAATKTRVEEYTFVRNLAKNMNGNYALDAATGYVMNWHMLPYILAKLGYYVSTIDIDPRTLYMPENSQIDREVGTLASLPYADDSFDLITCISTLEHVQEPVREAFVKEARRVARPGALFIVTADNYPGIDPHYLASLFEVDPDDYTEESLRFPDGKRVAYVVGRYS